MKFRYSFILIFTFLFLFNLAQYSESVKKFKLKGFVYDTSLKYIPYSRVEISNIAEEKSDSLPGYYVTYCDKKGNWELKIPFHKKIMIKIFSNGFIPNRKLINMEIEKSLNNSKTIVRSQMLKGLKHIEWGSFEHSMLYIKTEDLKSIEELIISNEYKGVDEFVKSNIKEHSRNVAYIFAGHAAFMNGAIQEAKEYFSNSGSKLWYNLMGRDYLRNGKYKESLEYYLKGNTTRKRAYDLMKLGEYFDENKFNSLKNKSFLKAMDDFNMLIVDYRFKWSNDLLRMRYGLYNNLLSKKEKKNSKELKDLLVKAGEYCKKLKKAEIYYYCNEEKIDKVVLIEDLHDAIENPRKYFDKYKKPKLKGIKIKDKYLYDLQFVLDENGVVEEARKLVHEYPDLKRNPVPVLSYKVVRPLYGPNTLIGFGWQDFFNYKIVGKEKLMNVETIIVDAFPKWSSFTNQMYGKLWVSNKDGSILKIEWKHQNLNRKDLRIRGLILNRIPGMRFISTYGKVRGGLRFPSQYRIIEYYSGDSDSFIRLDITGIYKDYTFFGVDIDDVKAE